MTWLPFPSLVKIAISDVRRLRHDGTTYFAGRWGPKTGPHGGVFVGCGTPQDILEFVCDGPQGTECVAWLVERGLPVVIARQFAAETIWDTAADDERWTAELIATLDQIRGRKRP